MRFTSLQIKLVVIFGLCVVIAVGAVMLYGIFATHRTEQFVTTSSSAVIAADAQELLAEKARMIGLTVAVELEVALDAARTLADVLSGIKGPMVENTFYGIAGVDMRMAFIQALADRVNQTLYNGAGRIAVISHNGILSAVSGQPEFAGKPLSTWMHDGWQNDLALLQAGQEKIDVKARMRSNRPKPPDAPMCCWKKNNRNSNGKARNCAR